MLPETDKRHFSRIDIDFDAEMVAESGALPTRVIDLSLKGALVERPEGLDAAPGKDIELVIRAPDDAFEVRMKARISHIDADQVGLECIEIDIDSITHLRRLVELNLGDGSLLHRELAELCRQA